ncbi:NAD(P)/FAD-dependent oxidoreductase [Leifsonia xyli]|uniref:NAD(P)/FAD-dependent oxidoreductase n=1 Tax=Leifsonia xyli TaxID=1575 RepID=UPI003D6681B9
MDILVIGAGAWGLPAALQLVARGHRVTLADEFGPGNPYASSGGSTRLWRVVDTSEQRAWAQLRAVRAMDRLAALVGAPVTMRLGLLWRDDAFLDTARAVLDATGSGYRVVRRSEVGDVLPGLRPDGRDALFVHEAGVVEAETLLRETLRTFRELGGRTQLRTRIARLEEQGSGVVAHTSAGATIRADHVVVAAGPGAAALLGSLGVRIPLQTYLEQVVHFPDPAHPDRYAGYPCFFDAPRADEPGIYGMPARQKGYKIGLDLPLRPLTPGDTDRSPVEARTERIRRRVERDLTSLVPVPGEQQVCAWTDSPDGDFVIDRLSDAVTVACGDSGEGFKFSALVGEHVADLVEGRPDAVLAGQWGMARIPDAAEGRAPTAMGRH